MHYFRDLFQSDRASAASCASTFSGAVSETEVPNALCSIRIGKTVPLGSAPSSALKACSHVVLAPLTKRMNAYFSGADALPEHWLLCHLALLPKPHKSTRRPENLRPLGIQDPAAKAYSRVIKNKFVEEVRDTILKFPQYAYLADRSTEDAIHRIVSTVDKFEIVSPPLFVRYTPTQKASLLRSYPGARSWHWTCQRPSTGFHVISSNKLYCRRTVDVQHHRVDGMPTCQHCWLKMTTWTNFRKHILKSCPVLHGKVETNPDANSSTDFISAASACKPTLPTVMPDSGPA